MDACRMIEYNGRKVRYDDIGIGIGIGINHGEGEEDLESIIPMSAHDSLSNYSFVCCYCGDPQGTSWEKCRDHLWSCKAMEKDLKQRCTRWGEDASNAEGGTTIPKATKDGGFIDDRDQSDEDTSVLNTESWVESQATTNDDNDAGMGIYYFCPLCSPSIQAFHRWSECTEHIAQHRSADLRVDNDALNALRPVVEVHISGLRRFKETGYACLECTYVSFNWQSCGSHMLTCCPDTLIHRNRALRRFRAIKAAEETVHVQSLLEHHHQLHSEDIMRWRQQWGVCSEGMVQEEKADDAALVEDTTSSVSNVTNTAQMSNPVKECITSEGLVSWDSQPIVNENGGSSDGKGLAGDTTEETLTYHFCPFCHFVPTTLEIFYKHLSTCKHRNKDVALPPRATWEERFAIQLKPRPSNTNQCLKCDFEDERWEVCKSHMEQCCPTKLENAKSDSKMKKKAFLRRLYTKINPWRLYATNEVRCHLRLQELEQPQEILGAPIPTSAQTLPARMPMDDTKTFHFCPRCFALTKTWEMMLLHWSNCCDKDQLIPMERGSSKVEIIPLDMFIRRNLFLCPSCHNLCTAEWWRCQKHMKVCCPEVYDQWSSDAIAKKSCTTKVRARTVLEWNTHVTNEILKKMKTPEIAKHHPCGTPSTPVTPQQQARVGEIRRDDKEGRPRVIQRVQEYIEQEYQNLRLKTPLSDDQQSCLTLHHFCPSCLSVAENQTQRMEHEETRSADNSQTGAGEAKILPIRLYPDQTTQMGNRYACFQCEFSDGTWKAVKAHMQVCCPRHRKIYKGTGGLMKASSAAEFKRRLHVAWRRYANEAIQQEMQMKQAQSENQSNEAQSTATISIQEEEVDCQVGNQRQPSAVDFSSLASLDPDTPSRHMRNTRAPRSSTVDRPIDKESVVTPDSNHKTEDHPRHAVPNHAHSSLMYATIYDERAAPSLTTDASLSRPAWRNEGTNPRREKTDEALASEHINPWTEQRGGNRLYPAVTTATNDPSCESRRQVQEAVRECDDRYAGNTPVAVPMHHNENPNCSVS